MYCSLWFIQASWAACSVYIGRFNVSAFDIKKRMLLHNSNSPQPWLAMQGDYRYECLASGTGCA